MIMRKNESSAEQAYIKPLTDLQWNEAIEEFYRLIQNEIEKKGGAISKTDTIIKFCEIHNLSYNTLQKWLNKDKINITQENRIRSASDKSFQGCICHYVKEPEKVLPSILSVHHVILEARWPTTGSPDELQNTLMNQAELISDIEKARKIGEEMHDQSLSTLDNMKKNIELIGLCKNIVEKLNNCKFSIHVGKVASFLQPESIEPDDISYIICVNSVRALRETLNPEDFLLEPNFEKAI